MDRNAPLVGSVFEQREDDRGYVHIRYDCPITQKDGWVPRHRAVLWATIGDKDQVCSWCGWGPLPWKSSEKPASRYVINVDHVNGIPGDDRPENLVVSCWWCNANRNWCQVMYPIWWERFLRWFRSYHPATRPNMAEMVGEIMGMHPKLLIYGQLVLRLKTVSEEEDF